MKHSLDTTFGEGTYGRVQSAEKEARGSGGTRRTAVGKVLNSQGFGNDTKPKAGADTPQAEESDGGPSEKK